MVVVFISYPCQYAFDSKPNVCTGVCDDLITSLILMPFAPIGFLIGYYLTNKIDSDTFYKITYSCLMVLGFKLLYEGVQGI